MGLNIAGTAVRAFGVDMQTGFNVLGAWGGYRAAKLNANMMEFEADRMRSQAKDLLEDAQTYIVSAGKAQRAGEEAAVNRYLQLGQDIGRIYSGAAGGNIEASSGVVRNTVSSARLMADRDVKAINASAADQANAYVAQARSSRLNYVNALEQANLMDVQAKYTRKVGKLNMYSGFISAAGGWMSGHASNASDMMGGFAGMAG